MYFLSAAWTSLQRRWLNNLFVGFGGVAVLAAMGTLGSWSYWLSQSSHQGTLKPTASAFLDTIDDSQVSATLAQISTLKGIQSARAITTEEFSTYLKEHFPTLADLVAGIGADVIPRLIEVELPMALSTSERAELLADIQSIPSVLRVDDGSARVAKALSSLSWLSFSGLSLAAGLWLVLLIVCLNHYQNILHDSQSELQLLRGFGATQFSLFLPWLAEAFLQALATSIVTVTILWSLRHQLLQAYNDFFGAIGYQPLRWNIQELPASFALTLLLAFGAHAVGSSLAFWKSKLV